MTELTRTFVKCCIDFDAFVGHLLDVWLPEQVDDDEELRVLRARVVARRAELAEMIAELNASLSKMPVTLQAKSPPAA